MTSESFNVVVGVDEVATETQKCQGWTCFILPEQYIPDFEKETKNILSKSGLKAFHGKKFKKNQSSEYSDFMILACEYIQKSPQSRLGNCLLSKNWATTLRNDFERIIVKGLNTAGITDARVINAILPYVEPSFTVLREAKNLGSNLGMSIQLDRDKEKHKDLSKVFYNHNGRDIPAKVIFEAALRAYQKKVFPNSPKFISAPIISAVTDAKSPIVQIADTIGNFSMAYIYKNLGDLSKSRVKKAEIFEKVLGQYLSKWKLSEKLEIVGKELSLKDNTTYLNFEISR